MTTGGGSYCIRQPPDGGEKGLVVHADVVRGCQLVRFNSREVQLLAITDMAGGKITGGQPQLSKQLARTLVQTKKW